MKLTSFQLTVLRRIAAGGADGIPVPDLSSGERCSAWALSHRHLIEMGCRGPRVWRVTRAGREAIAAAELADASAASIAAERERLLGKTERQRLAAGDRP